MSAYYSFERRSEEELCFTTEDETKVFVHPGDVMQVEKKGSGEYVWLVFSDEDRLLVDGCGGMTAGVIEEERKAWKPSGDRG